MTNKPPKKRELSHTERLVEFALRILQRCHANIDPLIVRDAVLLGLATIVSGGFVVLSQGVRTRLGRTRPRKGRR